MTIRPRAVKALRNVRERMRDAAAATHVVAAAARDTSRAALNEQHERMTAFLDDAPEVLAAARTIHELDQVAETTGVHRIAIADANARHVDAVAVTEQTAGKLRERTRQLRTAERLVERVDDSAAKLAARDEQRGNDDLAARRR